MQRQIWRNTTINDKSVDGVLGTETQYSMMEGADKSNELWLHPMISFIFIFNL